MISTIDGQLKIKMYFEKTNKFASDLWQPFHLIAKSEVLCPMGPAASCLKKKDILTVDVRKPGKQVAPEFSRAVFPRYEWETLKAFATKHGITQSQLISVFKTYLSHEEVYLREFRVRTIDFKNKLAEKSKLIRELADTFIPLIFSKDFPGLEPVVNPEEVSFARITVLGYVFLAQQIPDLIFDFFCILRQRFNLQLNATVFHLNFMGLVVALTEDLQPSETLRFMLQCLATGKDDSEMTILSIVRLGVKYPLLFYSLERFRVLLRRILYGDKFWADRKQLKTKVKLVDQRSDTRTAFRNERAALRETARSIISDVLFSAIEGIQYILNDEFVGKDVDSLDLADCERLKAVFGYALSKALIVESEIPLSDVPLFMRNYVHKSMIGHELVDPTPRHPPGKEYDERGREVLSQEERRSRMSTSGRLIHDISSRVQSPLGNSSSSRVQTPQSLLLTQFSPRLRQDSRPSSPLLLIPEVSEMFPGNDKQGSEADRGMLMPALLDIGKVQEERKFLDIIWRDKFIDTSAFDQVCYDKEAERNVRFNNATGYRKWAQHFISEDDELFKERYLV